MHTFVTRYGRRWSMLTLALLVLIGVLPLSAQAAADDAQPRFYVDRYYSASLGKEMTYRVYLPDGYYNGNQRYPVVYMLHEEGQSSRQFEDDRLQDSLDQWIAEGTIQKMIVVMPDTSGDSWFVNQDGGRWEDLIASDLVPVIDQRYPTIALPAFRGISGVSMGGFGAFVLGMRHPELFGSIASHMGALDRTVGGLQPLALIKGKTAAALKAYQYYLDGGTDDPMTYATNSTNDIHAYFRANNVAHGYQSRPGGHDKAYYLTYLNRSFMMHSASFAKGLLSGSFAASPQAISVDDTKVNVSFTVNLNRTSVANAVYENRANSAFNLNVSLKVSDPGSNAALYTANTSLGNVVQNSSLSSFTGSFTVPVSALGSLKSTNLTLDAKILGTSFTLGTKPLIRVAPTGTLPEDQQIDLLGDWRFTKDTYPTASINGADESLDTSGWSVVQPGTGLVDGRLRRLRGAEQLLRSCLVREKVRRAGRLPDGRSDADGRQNRRCGYDVYQWPPGRRDWLQQRRLHELVLGGVARIRDPFRSAAPRRDEYDRRTDVQSERRRRLVCRTDWHLHQGGGAKSQKSALAGAGR